jgi:hypothetical protein
MAERFSIRIEGLKAARAAFKQLSEKLQVELGTAALTTARATMARAGAKVPVRHDAIPGYSGGALRDAISAKLDARTGEAKCGLMFKRIAIAGTGGSALKSKGARLIQPTKYGHLVEFGFHHYRAGWIAGTSFMISSAEEERSNYVALCSKVGKDVSQQLSMSRVSV